MKTGGQKQIILIIAIFALAGFGIFALELFVKQGHVAEVPDSLERKPDTIWSPAFRSGYAKGKADGEDHASLGLNMPTPKAMQLLAGGHYKSDGTTDDAEGWQSGWIKGFEDGFAEAKRTDRPATANAMRYDQPSYRAGYKAGHDSAHIPLNQRAAMHRLCDAEVAGNHYDRKSYDEGFIAGTADADKGK
jgi:hypothetical protein